MFGYSDRELAVKSGYDLVHPDDLTYFSAAHQELIKTGSSGLIAYRWYTKDFRWLWLQSSCKVIYKNSKPDFVICTHRQLTDDEGQDLFHKRGNEFKLPYPLLDLDICSGLDFPNDDLISKMKNGKTKKQKNQIRDSYVQNPGRKKKGIAREPLNGLNGYTGYPQYNGYDNGEFKPDLLYPYPSNNFSVEPDIYRGYPSLSGSVYPTPDSYRLADTDKHSYTNGYYLDPHRQYQHPLGYHSNSYSDLVVPSTKYGYDSVSKYGFDSYSLDLAKKVHYNEDVTRYDNDFRKYAYDYGGERFQQRLNGSLEPVDLRSSSMYNGGHLMNSVDSMMGHGGCLPTSTLFKSDLGQNLLSKETKVICSPSDLVHNHQGFNSSVSLHHSSVIKNAASPRSLHSQSSRTSNSDQMGSPNSLYNNSGRSNVINNGTSWHCHKTGQVIVPSPNSTPGSDHIGSPKQNGLGGAKGDNSAMHIMASSPVTGSTPASVIHTAVANKTHPHRSYDKQSMSGGIPVPVVKSSPWYQYPTSHSAYGDPKDWGLSHNDIYSCQKSPRGIIVDPLSHVAKVPIT